MYVAGTISLAIHHHVHLTREQRYALHAGEDVLTVGVSVPVWFSGRATTEPAREVFCRYRLSNPRQDVPVRILENGYEISLPYREGVPPDLNDELWRVLNRDEPERLAAVYRASVEEVSSKNLLDPRDGGSRALAYREHNKVTRGEQVISVMHYVNIDPVESLYESLGTFSNP